LIPSIYFDCILSWEEGVGGIQLFLCPLILIYWKAQAV
jgi:hypothetical protein